MENTTGIRITKKDYEFSIAAGLLIGLLLLPILKAASPALYQKSYLAIVPFFLFATPLGLRIAFFIGKRFRIIWQVAKFGLIGVLNTLVDLGALALLTFLFRSYLNIDSKDALLGGILGLTFYSLYKAITFILANTNSYFWNKNWTFEQGGKTKTRAEFIQFFAVSIVGFIINVFVASIIFKQIIGSVAGLSEDQIGLIGAAFGSIAGLAWNFIGYKLWVFKK